MDYWVCECGKKVSSNSMVCPYCRKNKPGGVTPVSTGGTEARVVVTDFDMPFLSMIAFIMKWTLASIPAIITISLLLAVLATVFKGVLK
jgi:hypothetical protein